MPTTMAAKDKSKPASGPAAVLVMADSKRKSIPIWFARNAGWVREAPLTPAQKAWVEAQSFKGAARKQLLLPSPDGSIAGVVLGLGAARARDPMDRPELALGQLPAALPAGCYHLAEEVADPELAAVAWGLGAYRFRRYKSGEGEEAPAQLKVPRGADPLRALAQIEAVWLGRDLINTPASDMGPEQLEEAARRLAGRHGASVASVVGDALLAGDFPAIHAVGRASPRPPRLIDLTWGRPDARRVTLVGKGICFDTGGLDIKPANAMAIM
jgi:leucyl aminopeptidase